MTAVNAGSQWRHKKTGNTYFVLTEGKLEKDRTPVVIYQGGGEVWVRPTAEFLDGRFEPLSYLPPGHPGP